MSRSKEEENQAPQTAQMRRTQTSSSPEIWTRGTEPEARQSRETEEHRPRQETEEHRPLETEERRPQDETVDNNDLPKFVIQDPACRQEVKAIH